MKKKRIDNEEKMNDYTTWLYNNYKYGFLRLWFKVNLKWKRSKIQKKNAWKFFKGKWVKVECFWLRLKKGTVIKQSHM